MIKFFRFVTLSILGSIFAFSANSQVITGKVLDKQTNEPVIGVAVIVKGTTNGVSTDIDGSYTLQNVGTGSIITASCLSYKTIETDALTLQAGQAYKIDFSLENDDISIQGVQVVARKNLESENALQVERINASYAIENIGSSEMSLKGIANVAEGVKQLSGVSTADAGQIFVRGLGDRYSITTLNGLSIASPNPDNKLIPLDIFPSSVVKNITVSKVYNASAFADYSGARIDIGTKETVGENYHTVSFGTGMNVGTQFNDFYKADNVSVFKSSNISNEVKNIVGTTNFNNYIQGNNIFETTFDVDKITAMPDFNGSFAFGHTWDVRESNKISVLASFSASKSSSSMNDSFVSKLNAQGVTLSQFDYDSYKSSFNMTGLASATYMYDGENRIGYTMFYARNLSDEYSLRDGYDSESDNKNLIGSNSVRHIYTLLNNQLSGKNKIANNLFVNWAGSYGTTGSDEPDRRQVMYYKDGDNYRLFKLNSQETMRYFSELDETEAIADINFSYEFGYNNIVRLGGTYKDKDREFSSMSFYYNLDNISSSFDSPYNGDNFLSYSNIQDGIVSVTKFNPSRTKYFAGTEVAAAFAEVDYNIGELLVNLGLRYENATSWVQYWTDAAEEELAELAASDLFPTLNLKYNLANSKSLRFGASRTITRPSFIEMAPFLYESSYGGMPIRGNADIENGYNYNVDLRYELFANESNNMFSVTGYYKYLQNPIECVQVNSGGDPVYTFLNASDGMAAGIEVEFRRSLAKNLRFGCNASYMYTNIVLAEDGVYTDKERMLQGASPYLANADLTYTKKYESGDMFSAAILYNLQGKRIDAVGIDGLNNVIQDDVHTVNLACSYKFASSWALKLNVGNVLDSKIKFHQEVMSTGENVLVESYSPGVDVSLGASFNF